MIRRFDMDDADGDVGRMDELFTTITLISPKDVPVLVHGESNLANQLVARTIHVLSSRSKAPFVRVNCASLLENKFSNQIELAQHGTLFIEEIGDANLNVQNKILNVLNRDSSAQELPVPDVRVIATTNKNLKGLVESGSYNGKLFYRLPVIELWLPKSN